MIPKSGYRFSGSCSNNMIERDDDSTKSHRALDGAGVNCQLLDFGDRLHSFAGEGCKHLDPQDGAQFVLYPATRLVTAPPVAVRPPSTTNCPPVVLEARSEQRNSTMLAISSAVV